MAERSAPNCKCQQKQTQTMKLGHQLGLDELMIVNPGKLGAEAVFLGDDGILYQIRGLGGDSDPQGTAEFFLGDDGTLYQVHGVSAANTPEPDRDLRKGLGRGDSHELGRYFLGADGMLYEVVGR